MMPVTILTHRCRTVATWWRRSCGSSAAAATRTRKRCSGRSTGGCRSLGTRRCAVRWASGYGRCEEVTLVFQRFFGVCLIILIMFSSGASASPFRLFGKVIDPGDVGRPVGDICLHCPPDGPWTKPNTDRLAEILRVYRLDVKPEQIDESVVEDAWRTRIFPELRDELSASVPRSGREYWKNVGNACRLYSLAQMEPGELVLHLLVGKADAITSGRVSDLLFVSQFVTPQVLLQDPICPLLRKAFSEWVDQSLEKSLDLLGMPQSVSHCIQIGVEFVRDTDDYRKQVEGGCR